MPSIHIAWSLKYVKCSGLALEIHTFLLKKITLNLRCVDYSRQGWWQKIYHFYEALSTAACINGILQFIGQGLAQTQSFYLALSLEWEVDSYQFGRLNSTLVFSSFRQWKSVKCGQCTQRESRAKFEMLHWRIIFVPMLLFCSMIFWLGKPCQGVNMIAEKFPCSSVCLLFSCVHFLSPIPCFFLVMNLQVP